MKVCTSCGVERPLEEFSYSRTQSRHRPCLPSGAVLRLRAKYRATVGPHKIRLQQIKHRYGVTEQQYEQMLAESNGVCPICGEAESRDRMMSLDHDHRTGEIRGLICDRCNRALGAVDDNVWLLHRLAHYLIKRKVRTLWEVAS